MVQIRYRQDLSAFETSAEKLTLFGGRNESREVSFGNMSGFVAGRFSIPVSSNEDLPLGDVPSVRGVRIWFDGSAVLQLNGGTEQFAITPVDASSAAARAHFAFDGSLTAINVANASTTTVLTGTYAVFGDPTSGT